MLFMIPKREVKHTMRNLFVMFVTAVRFLLLASSRNFQHCIGWGLGESTLLPFKKLSEPFKRKAALFSNFSSKIQIIRSIT